MPFGGVKSSGHGREKGFEALLGFTTLKTIAIQARLKEQQTSWVVSQEKWPSSPAAASGFGEGIAERFAGEGCAVVVNDITRDAGMAWWRA